MAGWTKTSEADWFAEVVLLILMLMDSEPNLMDLEHISAMYGNSYRSFIRARGIATKQDKRAGRVGYFPFLSWLQKERTNEKTTERYPPR